MWKNSISLSPRIFEADQMDQIVTYIKEKRLRLLIGAQVDVTITPDGGNNVRAVTRAIGPWDRLNERKKHTTTSRLSKVGKLDILSAIP
jgi:hypothetical protein